MEDKLPNTGWKQIEMERGAKGRERGAEEREYRVDSEMER